MLNIPSKAASVYPNSLDLFYVTLNSVIGKKKFSYRGCGWKSIDVKSWSEETNTWIMIINDLFNKMFGGDFLPCLYSKEHGTTVADEVMSSVLDYSHEH